MNPNRKPSPQSPLKMLPDAEQERLAEFLRDATLAEGVAFAARDLGVKTNDTSLSDWFRWFRMMQRISSYRADAESFKEALTQTTVDPDLIPKLGEALFIARAAEEGDAKTFATVASVIQRHAELEAQKAAHSDKMELGREQAGSRRKGLAIALRKLRSAEKKVALLEAQAAATKDAAARAKGMLKDGSAGLTDEARAALLSTMDEMLLGKKRQ